MKKLILCCAILLFTNLSWGDDSNLLSNDFDLTSQASDSKRRLWLLGEVSDTNFSIVHTNDEDLLGFLHKLGLIPSDDDIGRTAALNLAYEIIGENGRIDIGLNSQLFSSIPDGYDDSDDIQNILEETTVSIVARLIKSEEKKTYVILGVSYTNQAEHPVIMTYLQDFIHRMGAGTPRQSLHGDLDSHFVNAIIGAGKVFEIIKNERVTVSVVAEVTAEVSTSLVDQSRAGFMVKAIFDFGLWRDSNDPALRFTMQTGGNIYHNRYDFWAKVELTLRLKLKKQSNWYIETGVFVGYFDTEFDREYEGEASFQTGLSIRIVRRRPRTPDDHFLF